LSIEIDLERFEHFKDAEWRLLEAVSPTEIKVVFAVQDKARAFDWITIIFTFTGVVDAKLLDGNRISHVDMGDGINIIKDENLFAFGIGECYNVNTIKNSSCYIIASDMKYEEGQF
jgi:hypothetical protein